jgi:flagellar biosynthesis/type III secretory pathway protein FliH
LLGPRAEEIVMTIAEQLIEEGRQEGWEKGRVEGRQEGRVEGRQEGRVEGRQEAQIATLRRQLICKFKLQALEPAYEACLQAATPAAFDRYVERVLTADSLAAVFAD